MNIVENDLSEGFDFGPKVTIEIDGDLARTLMTLAHDCAFGNDFSLTDLEPLVNHLLSNRARAGKRKRDLMLKASKKRWGQPDADLEGIAERLNTQGQPEDMEDNEANE